MSPAFIELMKSSGNGTVWINTNEIESITWRPAGFSEVVLTSGEKHAVKERPEDIKKLSEADGA